MCLTIQQHENKKSPLGRSERSLIMFMMFRVLASRCLTGSALLDCHVLKRFGIYMIGILDS